MLTSSSRVSLSGLRVVEDSRVQTHVGEHAVDASVVESDTDDRQHVTSRRSRRREDSRQT